MEKIQSFSADPLTVCEHCGGPLEKLISASAFQFKGSGWYVTDYARSGGTASASGDKKPSDGAPAQDGKDSGDAKPASTDATAGSPAQGAGAAPKPANATPDK